MLLDIVPTVVSSDSLRENGFRNFAIVTVFERDWRVTVSAKREGIFLEVMDQD